MNKPILPEFFWMASTDSPYWGIPRRVYTKALLTGPDSKRQYLLLSVEVPAVEPYPDYPTPRDVVLTPRHERQIVPSEPGKPLRCHLWIARPATDIINNVFTPSKPEPDSWVELWSSYDEATRYGAKPW
jgi:hypothetical protein